MRALVLALSTLGLATSLAAAQEVPVVIEAPSAPAAAAPPAAAPPAAPVEAPAPPPVAQAPAAPAPVPQQAPVYQAPVYQAPAYAPPPSAAPAPGTFTPYSSPLTPGGGRPVYQAPSTYQLPPPAWSTPRPAPAQPPATYVLPPPPNGYMYMPVPMQQNQQLSLTQPDVARRDQIYAELQQTEARLAQVKQDKIGVGGPITLIIVGFGTTVVSGLIGLSNFAAAERIQHEDYDPRYDQGELDHNDDGKINGHDASEFRQDARIAGAIAGVGLLVGIFGAARLSHKREERRKQALEIRTLTYQRDNLRAQLGLSSAPGYYGVGVQGHF